MPKYFPVRQAASRTLPLAGSLERNRWTNSRCVSPIWPHRSSDSGPARSPNPRSLDGGFGATPAGRSEAMSSRVTSLSRDGLRAHEHPPQPPVPYLLEHTAYAIGKLLGGSVISMDHDQPVGEHPSHVAHHRDVAGVPFERVGLGPVEQFDERSSDAIGSSGDLPDLGPHEEDVLVKTEQVQHTLDVTSPETIAGSIQNRQDLLFGGGSHWPNTRR